MNTTYDNSYDFSAMLQLWGPRVLAALAILIAAWAIGRAVKWAIARGVDTIPALAHHNKGVEPKATAGARLGDVAYWLILLVGIVAALTALQLSQVVTPLNTLLTNFFSYIPNVVGALLIFFIGFIVATLARRIVTAALQAANLERWLAKVGLTAVTGGALPSALGTLVFVLILIPVTIAALETLQVEAISAPAIAVLGTVLNAIPNVLAAAIVLAIGFLIGRWIASVVERILPATGFDKAVAALGAFSTHARPSMPTPPRSTIPPASLRPSRPCRAPPPRWSPPSSSSPSSPSQRSRRRDCCNSQPSRRSSRTSSASPAG